jgi:RHS repeat-associated protein
LLPNQAKAFTANDQLTSDSYDANGNTTGSADLQSASSATDIYSFDNRLIRRTRGDGVVIDLTYNADGDRVSKRVTENGFTRDVRLYLVDRANPTGYAQVVEEKDHTGQLVARNLYGHDLIASDTRSAGVPPVSSTVNRHWYTYDGLGSVRGISDDNGDLHETYDYDAYGTLIGLTKRNATTGELVPVDLTSSNSEFRTPNSDFLFTGEQWDADLGMYFLRARYLNPDTGRFHTQDTYEGRNGEPLSLHK